MTARPIPTCGDENQTPKEWKPVTFEYSEDEISVSVPNIYAWVSPLDGDVSFTPDTVDELIATVRELIEAAKRAQQHRPAFTEYFAFWHEFYPSLPFFDTYIKQIYNKMSFSN